MQADAAFVKAVNEKTAPVVEASTAGLVEAGGLIAADIKEESVGLIGAAEPEEGEPKAMEPPVEATPAEPAQESPAAAAPAAETPPESAAEGTLEDASRRLLLAALTKHGGNASAAMREMNVGRTRFYRMIKKFGRGGASAAASRVVAQAPQKPNSADSASRRANASMGTPCGPRQSPGRRPDSWA